MKSCPRHSDDFFSMSGKDEGEMTRLPGWIFQWSVSISQDRQKIVFRRLACVEQHQPLYSERLLGKCWKLVQGPSQIPNPLRNTNFASQPLNGSNSAHCRVFFGETGRLFTKQTCNPPELR